MLTIWRATAAQRHVVSPAVTRGAASVATAAASSENGDERKSVRTSSYAPVYWNDEKHSARQTATRTPLRAAPARELRPPSKSKA
jgi:hypothetical protein